MNKAGLWGGLTLVLLLCLALAFSVATSWRDRQKLQAITAANEYVRKTLGEMTVALADKDREIDRLLKSPCDKSAAPSAVAAR
jgi:hypothetical protein